MSNAPPPPFERCTVLGVPVDLVTEPEVLAAARGAVEHGKRAQIVTVNAEFVVMAQEKPTFLRALQDAAVATPDGAGVVWALRRRGIDIRRLGGSDLIWSLSEQAARLGHSVFFLGAAEGVAQEVAHRLSLRYPGLRVAGALAGTPREEDEEAIAARIHESGADILFVAYGAPEQDLWISRNLDHLGVSVAIGVGGSFDYVAGKARRAPPWMRDRGLDWLWRLVMQPWRWRRMLALPRFALLVLTARGGGIGQPEHYFD